MKTSVSLAIDWRRPRSIVTLLLTFALVSAFFVMHVRPARADAGNPILGTIKATSVDNGDGTVTVFVRGQWNWLSHTSDCNTDRAATGVGIAWQDPNGPGTKPGSNETQRVQLTGGPTGGTYKLKFNGVTMATGVSATATAAQLQSALEGLSSIGPGNVTVTRSGSGTAALPYKYDVTFVGTLGKLDVPAMTLASKSFTGGTNPTVTITTPTPGVNAVYNGYLLTNGLIRAYIGTSSEEFNGATRINRLDEMVHPVDRGNQVEGYTVAGTDYPATQAFVDPVDGFGNPSPSLYASWKGGCGRQPLTDTASNNAPGTGPNGEATGASCGTGNTACSGHPWGSWGYEKFDSTHYGYSHTYLKVLPDPTPGTDPSDDNLSGLPDKVCVNFYDVHGGGTTPAKFQVPNGASDITVDGNGDNSIQTNAFNVNNGANCITVELPSILVTKNPHSQAVASGGTASWDIHVENTGNVTLTDVNVTDTTSPTANLADDCIRTSADIIADPNAPNPGTATFDPGDTYDYSCTSVPVTAPFKNVVVACGTFANPGDTCDDDQTTLDNRTGAVIIASTKQDLKPKDTITLSGLGGTPDGMVTFSLYKDDAGMKQCTDPAHRIYQATASLSASGNDYVASVESSSYLSALNLAKFGSSATAGNYNWLVTYTGDTQGNADITIACGTENFQIDNG